MISLLRSRTFSSSLSCRSPGTASIAFCMSTIDSFSYSSCGSGQPFMRARSLLWPCTQQHRGPGAHKRRPVSGGFNRLLGTLAEALFRSSEGHFYPGGGRFAQSDWRCVYIYIYVFTEAFPHRANRAAIPRECEGGLWSLFFRVPATGRARSFFSSCLPRTPS